MRTCSSRSSTGAASAGGWTYGRCMPAATIPTCSCRRAVSRPVASARAPMSSRGERHLLLPTLSIAAENDVVPALERFLKHLLVAAAAAHPAHAADPPFLAQQRARVASGSLADDPAGEGSQVASFLGTHVCSKVLCCGGQGSKRLHHSLRQATPDALVLAETGERPLWAWRAAWLWDRALAAVGVQVHLSDPPPEAHERARRFRQRPPPPSHLFARLAGSEGSALSCVSHS